MVNNTLTSEFWKINLPSGRTAYLPNDIVVKLPQDSVVPKEKLHLLAYIPWDDKYFDRVPKEYLEFFRFVLPHLNARTTNVHTALSVSYAPELIASTPEAIDETITHISVILHDSGWAQLSPEMIADSLDYSALAYSPKALEPKRLHATLGAEVSRKILNEYPGHLNLSDQQKEFICDLVYYHDQVQPWPKTSPKPIEYLLLGDADRLWSYTHENFWLDTIRKNVVPAQYVKNLDEALESFFLTEQGRVIARRLIVQRKEEVALCPTEVEF